MYIYIGVLAYVSYANFCYIHPMYVNCKKKIFCKNKQEIYILHKNVNKLLLVIKNKRYLFLNGHNRKHS